MTAEIAILNMSAVALAADSAVTISAGTEQHKVFDSEDKLFELSCVDPVGVMINGNMQFMGAPLPVLIKRYRETCGRFVSVGEAAANFLEHLREFGAISPQSVHDRGLYATLRPIWQLLRTRYDEKLRERYGAPVPPETENVFEYFEQLRVKVLGEQIAVITRAFDGLPETMLIGEAERSIDGDIIATIHQLNADNFEDIEEVDEGALRELADSTLKHRVLMSPHTGTVVAGFAASELFPTLVSFEVYGMVGNQLRVYQTNDVDIDREGEKSRIIPFAQKEMVDRFLYGLDDETQRRITDFCRQAVPTIGQRMVDNLTMSDEDQAAMQADLATAEAAFLDSLREEVFDVIRGNSENAMNDMIELMPKPEMARMAEALVNLTSIKRRVTRGMETVGGPIDVAIISRAEGFVWVKRKHYFSHELNSRYFDRMRQRNDEAQEG